MRSHVAAVLTMTCLFVAPAVPAQPQANVAAVEEKLNQAVFSVTARNRSYRTLFDAFLEARPAPSGDGLAGRGFNVNTIHPRMSDWTRVSGWAESNPGLRQAILDCRGRLLIGLPYGQTALERDLGDASRFGQYLDAGLYADIAVDGHLRDQAFPYLRVMDTIAAFSVAECYRLLEAGDAEMAMELAVAQTYVIDQLCERQFLAEKMHAMQLQIDFLAAVRDMIYLYEDKLSTEQLAGRSYYVGDNERKGLAFELPWLRIDLLEMPSADYEVANELLRTVFRGDDPDPDRFVDVFAELQSDSAPLTQFGAAKRWRMVAMFHSSLDASQERLKLVYDDWWRRWSVRAWHDILSLETQYERTNPIRFAAVIFAMKDIGAVFDKRRELIAAVNGTAMAAAVVAYKKQFGVYPDDIKKAYATFVRSRTDIDPFDRTGGGFGYRYLTSPIFVETRTYGFIEVSGGLLWSRGFNYESGRGQRHSDDGRGAGVDLVLWPPMRAISRSAN